MNCHTFPSLRGDRLEESANLAVDIWFVAMVSVDPNFASLSVEAESLKSIQIVPWEFVARIGTQVTIKLSYTKDQLLHAFFAI